MVTVSDRTFFDPNVFIRDILAELDPEVVAKAEGGRRVLQVQLGEVEDTEGRVQIFECLKQAIEDNWLSITPLAHVSPAAWLVQLDDKRSVIICPAGFDLVAASLASLKAAPLKDTP
mgnify:CR=1 FL=1